MLTYVSVLTEMICTFCGVYLQVLNGYVMYKHEVITHVCMYVCTHIYTYVCMYVHTYIRTYICTHIYMYVQTKCAVQSLYSTVGHRGSGSVLCGCRGSGSVLCGCRGSGSVLCGCRGSGSVLCGCRGSGSVLCGCRGSGSVLCGCRGSGSVLCGDLTVSSSSKSASVSGTKVILYEQLIPGAITPSGVGN